MSGEVMELIETLKLNEDTDDEALAEARTLALKHLRSRSPIPQTVLTVVQRGSSNPTVPTAPTVAEAKETNA